jgi:periplasmic copper chaperone A
MRPVRQRLPLLLVAALLVVIVAACSAGSGTGSSSGAPAVSGAWVRPAPAGGQTAAYLTITGGSTADALVSVSSPAASVVQLHQTSMDPGMAGMAGMHPVASLAIPAGGSVSLSPGGYHLMISGLSQALATGGMLELDLVFQHAGTVVVKADVKAG